MEMDDQVVLKSRTKKEYYDEEFSFSNYILYIIITIIFFLILIINYFYFTSKNGTNNANSNLDNSVREIEDALIFDKNTLEKLKRQQIEFCKNNNNQNNFIKEYEEQITLTKVCLLSQLFDMYVYKNNDIISTEIINTQSWDGDKINNLLTPLLYYSIIKSLKPQDIYVLDIGSHIGWYSLFIAKFGYNIISFEPSEMNNYILNKNLCINKELNITLIKKGLYNEERKCDFFINQENIGDGWVFCDKKENLPGHLKKTGEVMVTKLENYVQFLTQNNLGLIKIDIEGAEEKALESGFTLISKYRVPFIFMEFNPRALEAHGTDPRNFLKRFLKYGYRFARYNFFDNDFYPIDEIMGRTNDGSNMNLFIVHYKITKKYYKS